MHFSEERIGEGLGIKTFNKILEKKKARVNLDTESVILVRNLCLSKILGLVLKQE